MNVLHYDLPTFYHDGDKVVAYKVPDKYDNLADLYTIKLISTSTASILLRPAKVIGTPDLPQALARYRDYEVYVPETMQAFSFIGRFERFAEFEEREHRAKAWKGATRLITRLNGILAILDEELAQRKASK